MARTGKLNFGPFEFEPDTGRLAKNGDRVKLQGKAAAILACLLERPSEVVSRAQLQERLWADGVHVDFELGIKVAMKKLRDALGDLSEDPAFIQTIYGEGYRFIATVTRVTEAAVSSGAGRGWIRWAAAITVALFLLSGASMNPLHFQNRDWVVIAAFENPTGEKVLDGSLEYALERELSLSRYVNVVPRERVGDALKLMRQSPNAVLNEDLARQVAIRDGGIKAVLSGRVEKASQKYVLTVRVVNPADSAAVAVFKREGSKDQLADGAGSIAGEIRRRLGEPRPAQPERLEKATTPSLAALRAFSLGMRNVNETKWDAAAALLEEATREDPQFASAHIYAAHCYTNVGKGELAAPHFEAAYRFASSVSQRERLFILGSYYSRSFHRDDAQALAAYEALTNLYPDDFWGVNNLANMYVEAGRLREANDAFRRAFALRPNDSYPPFLVARLDLENAADRWRSGDVKGAAQEVARVSAHAMIQTDDKYTGLLAFANLTLGRFAAAKNLCGHVDDFRWRQECFLRTAYVSGDLKMCKELLSQLRFTKPPDLVVYADMMIALRSGEIAIAKKWEQEDGRKWDDLDGQILLAEGHPKEAIEKVSAGLSGSTGYGLKFPLVDWADAMGQLGKIEEAIVRLDMATRPADVNLMVDWMWTDCRVKLAELYRKAGREQDAVKTENEMRLYLSEADSDHPVLARLRPASR
jgi:DNA-binding winged helix-turn-helix (wHTH) protein/tetratricopeptide (TPR) repeat protein